MRVQQSAAASPLRNTARVAGAATASTSSAPDRLERSVLNRATANNRVTLHLSPEASHEAILASIRNAKKSYFIETFIWHNDKAGQEVISALAERKRQAEAKGETFDVKILIDWFGLRQGSGGSDDTAIVGQMRELGFQVLEFSPGYWSRDAQALIPITHRKLYIADGDQFITGGRNIGNEYLKPTYEVKSKGVEEHSWHDLLYTVRGPETGRIIDEFFVNWKRAGGTVSAERPEILADGGGQARIQSFVTDPHGKSYGLRSAHFRAIREARKEIVAIYPYFSDDGLVNELIKAKRARPNLSIKVLLPSNKEASHEGTIYSLLNKENAQQLLDAGIEVRMFDGGTKDGQAVQRFSHMKGLLIDNQLLSIGSANGDARTYANNHELNTLIADAETVRDYRRQVVDPDWAAGQPLKDAELKRAPLMERIKRRVLEWLDFLL